MELATYDANTKKVKLSKTAITLLVAVIAIVPALVTACTELAVKPFTKTLENDKLKLDQRKASAELYRSALANAEAGQRHKLVKFLIDAKLVDENAAVSAMPPEGIPHWPATTP